MIALMCRTSFSEGQDHAMDVVLVAKPKSTNWSDTKLVEHEGS